MQLSVCYSEIESSIWETIRPVLTFSFNFSTFLCCLLYTMNHSEQGTSRLFGQGFSCCVSYKKKVCNFKSHLIDSTLNKWLIFFWVFLQTSGSVLDYKFIYSKNVTLTHSNPKLGANVPQEKSGHHSLEDEQKNFSLHKSGQLKEGQKKLYAQIYSKCCNWYKILGWVIFFMFLCLNQWFSKIK